MNTTAFPEDRPSATADPQSPLPLATQDVLRYVWEGRFGSILIEVVRGRIFVGSRSSQPAPEVTYRRPNEPASVQTPGGMLLLA